MDKQKFEQVFANFEKKYRKIQKINADVAIPQSPDTTDNDDTDDDSQDSIEEIVQDIYTDMYYLINSLRQYMYQQDDASYAKWNDHSKGHLPNAKTPSQMEKALKVLGMDQDYSVARPTIYATRTNAGLKFEVDLNLPKSKE